MELKEVIDSLQELKEDLSVPKNVKLNISNIISELESDKDLSLRVNKSLSVLEEISEDINLPTFIRTHLWSITSMLEKLQRFFF